MSTYEELRPALLSKKDSFTDILGQDDVKEQLKSALLTGRHLLIMGPPGIGKTTLAKNIAKLLPSITVNDCPYHCSPDKPLCPECKTRSRGNALENSRSIASKQKTKKISGEERFIRIQGSPDLTAEDLIGDIDPIKALKFGPLSLEAFTPGKIFKANNGILFFDELNRAPEKLQNALLQVLEERKATIGSYDVDLETNFVFIGTMNPEDVSTEPLSDVLLDRFDIIYMKYPEDVKVENEIVKLKGEKVNVSFPENLLNATILFVRLLRENKKMEKVPSVRASIGLYERSQSNALLRGKKAVDIKDIKDAVVSVMSHRIRLKPSAQYLQTPAELISEEFEKFLDVYKPSSTEEELESDYLRRED